ncbi:hypothetical protein AMATHDRAFT_77925 [Amanita thiersii Skay4041]|uniref:Uncharacterized protein n=1 Tax=Amanita thiersii Skay4041 TaxID=703135 RepID=A0A2A9NBZ2_9AGAR|nr:hypothetical protein AMATHDRAFT_77925 [Amanita thiersii Skay4041]
MADDAPAQEIQINVKGPSELKLQISISTDKTVLELKQAIAAKSNVEAERQRLIYSGRVLKDDDQLSTYKIQSSHTIHMVKGVSRTSASTSTQSTTTPQQLPTMQAGQNPHDPLTQLNSHLGFGAMAGLNPFTDLGLNPNDPNMAQTMMNSPEFMQQMSSLLQNPAIIDQIIASNPQLANMAPQVREAFSSPQFREMISNPDRLQQMMQMATAFRQAGLPPMPFGGMPFGMGGGFPGGAGFPSPGVPSATTGTTSPPQSPAQGQQTSGTTAGTGNTGGQAPQQQAPFNLFGAAAGAGAGARGASAGAGSPFGAYDPALLQQLMGMGSFGGAFGGGMSPPVSTDTRPPEERFQAQLQQLQEMGFTNAQQNIRALLATAGNVHSAIEYILNGGGL